MGLLGEPQLFDKRPPARIAVDVLQKYRDFRERDSRITLSISALEPLERGVRVSAICVRFRNLVRGTIRIARDEFLQRGI